MVLNMEFPLDGEIQFYIKRTNENISPFAALEISDIG